MKTMLWQLRKQEDHEQNEQHKYEQDQLVIEADHREVHRSKKAERERLATILREIEEQRRELTKQEAKSLEADRQTEEQTKRDVMIVRDKEKKNPAKQKAEVAKLEGLAKLQLDKQKANRARII